MKITKVKQLTLLLIVGCFFSAVGVHAQTAQVTPEVPWGWYVSRSAGLLGFVMLYLSIFLGLTIRINWLKKMFPPFYALDAHKWISVQALLLALAHGLALTFDKFLNFSLSDVLIPFSASYETNLVALGQIAFYLMLLLTITSYGRRFISQSIWRMTHSLNVGLYLIGVAHALYLGTDLKTGMLRQIFIWANILLMILFVYNIFVRIMLARQSKLLREAEQIKNVTFN